MASIERYEMPENIEEAVRIISDGDATIFAGGTDLIPRIRKGLKEFNPLLVNIRRIPELKGISQSNGVIRIGALVTVTEILKSTLLRDRAGILPRTADSFASGQVRNSATIGGNICNGSPAGDMIIPLLLLDADLELASWSKGNVAVRKMPLSDFFVGPGITRIEPGEILTSIRFSLPAENFVALFRKFGMRPAMDISVVSAGIAGTWEKGRLKNARIALGAVAPIPMRAHRAEALIEGEALNDEIIERAAKMAMEEISPISDERASAWYRRELTGVFIERMLNNVDQQGD